MSVVSEMEICHTMNAETFAVTAKPMEVLHCLSKTLDPT